MNATRTHMYESHFSIAPATVGKYNYKTKDCLISKISWLISLFYQENRLTNACTSVKYLFDALC